jgi:hypothetical protein
VALKLLFKRALKASAFTSLRTKSKELVFFVQKLIPFDTRKIYCRLNVPPFCNFILEDISKPNEVLVSKLSKKFGFLYFEDQDK